MRELRIVLGNKGSWKAIRRGGDQARLIKDDTTTSTNKLCRWDYAGGKRIEARPCHCLLKVSYASLYIIRYLCIRCDLPINSSWPRSTRPTNPAAPPDARAQGLLQDLLPTYPPQPTAAARGDFVATDLGGGGGGGGRLDSSHSLDEPGQEPGEMMPHQTNTNGGSAGLMFR